MCKSSHQVNHPTRSEASSHCPLQLMDKPQKTTAAVVRNIVTCQVACMRHGARGLLNRLCNLLHVE